MKKEPIISGRDHLDFLESIDKSIVGKKLSLMDPWRMLMMVRDFMSSNAIWSNTFVLVEVKFTQDYIFNKLLFLSNIPISFQSTQLQEIVNRNEKAPFDKHVRHVFLFNDLLLVRQLFYNTLSSSVQAD